MEITPQHINEAMARHLKWSKCACNDPHCGVWFDPSGESQLGLPDLVNDPQHNELKNRVVKFYCDIASNRHTFQA